MFAFDANVAAHPPNRRVIEQDGLHCDQHHIYDGIEPADMGKLMQDERVQLLRRQARQCRNRDQDHGPQPADHHRDIDSARQQEPHRRRHRQAALQKLAALQQIGGWRHCIAPRQLSGHIPAPQRPEA